MQAGAETNDFEGDIRKFKLTMVGTGYFLGCIQEVGNAVNTGKRRLWEGQCFRWATM